MQAGRGGTSRSQANNTSTGDTGNDATVVFAAVDPKAEQRGLYLNNTLKAIEARSLLVEELFKGPDRNVETIKQQLQTLVVENRRVYGSKTPNALVLNMGFNAYPGKSDKAVTMARMLLSQAATLQNQLGDPACEQMLQWICDQWNLHIDIHREQPAPKTVGEIAQEIRLKQERSTLDVDQLSESDYRSEEDDHEDEEANTIAPLKAFSSTVPKPDPRGGAGHSEFLSETSTGSRMERSTASTSQERKSHKRSMSAAPPLAPTTMNSGSVATPTTTATTTITTTVGVTRKPSSPAHPSHKRSASAAATPAPTTMNSNSVTTATATSTATSTATVSAVRKARLPADVYLNPARIAAHMAAEADLRNPNEILRRAKVQNDLIAAIDAGDGATVLSILKTLPKPLHLLPYFPPPDILRSYEKAEAWTSAFAKQQGIRGLRQPIKRMALAAKTHDDIMKRISRDAGMRKLYPVEVQNVCNTLLACPEAQVQAQAKALESAIKQIMKSPYRNRLAELLAEQPFAGTRLLHLRCTLLQQHTKGNAKTVRAFHRLVEKARDLQADAGEYLARALLNKDSSGRPSMNVPPSRQAIMALVRTLYALMATTSPSDYLLRHLSWVDAEAVREKVHLMHKQATAASGPDQEQTWEATMLSLLKEWVDHTMRRGPRTADSE